MRWRVEWLSQDNTADLGLVAVALRNDWEVAVNPDDPPAGLDEYLARRRRAPSHYRSATAVGFVDGEGVALAECSMMLGVNSHLLDVRTLQVLESYRRQGVGTKLLRSVAAHGYRLGYTSIVVWAKDDAGMSFCEHHGLIHQTTERYSRLAIDDVDGAQQDAWATGEEAIAAGYQLVRIGEHCQDELLDPACAGYDAEQDAPTGELDYTHPRTDPDVIRSSEADLRTAGLASFRALALAPDGTGAGITELCVNTHRPQLGIQGTTAVVAEHRGRRIGRWLKAVNLADARADYPQLRNIETTNAETNPWMLAINEAMGFRAHHTWRLCGGPIPQILGEISWHQSDPGQRVASMVVRFDESQTATSMGPSSVVLSPGTMATMRSLGSQPSCERSRLR